MIKGLYTSANGMITQLKKLDVTSNNIANLDTTAYKKDNITSESFKELLVSRINSNGKSTKIGSVSLGVTVDRVYTDFSQGSLKQTYNDLDIALDSIGFMNIIKEEEGQVNNYYTRDGSFVLTKEGNLVTKDGYQVMGEEGPINLPQGDIHINEFGEIYVNDNYINKIKVVNFEDSTRLIKKGENLYTNNDNESIEYTGKVLQGFTEASNVNPIRELTEMINVTRTYEASQKVLQAHDETLGKAVNELGRL